MNDRPRIVFVDDEPEVLAGIRASLRRERARWDFEFCDSGDAALRSIEDQPADVLVTDMRMPGLDGAGLLRSVHRSHPEVVRIVLSGDASAEQAMRSLPHVHRWLPKPCDRDLLVDTIESALGGERSRLVDALVGGVTSLPSPPAMYGQLVAELDDPDATFESVASLVEADPAITAKVLQWGSSPLVGWGQLDRVSDVLRAIGLAAVAQLVLSVEVLEQIGDDNRVPGCDPETMRRHAELTGQFAASMTDRSERGVARTAGLLHTVGLLVVTTRAHDRVVTAVDTARLAGLPLAELEESVLGVTLPEVGARLLRLWGLPLDVSSAVATHASADVTAGAHLPAPAAVRVGSWVASSMLCAEGHLDRVFVAPRPPMPTRDEAGWRRDLEAAVDAAGLSGLVFEEVTL